MTKYWPLGVGVSPASDCLSSEAAEPIGLVRGIECTDRVVRGTSRLKGHKITVPSGYDETLFVTDTISSPLECILQTEILQAEILSSVIAVRYYKSITSFNMLRNILVCTPSPTIGI